MRSKPPTIAKCLLERFGVPQRNESLMGDLAEEHASGRSALWFWRQTFVAIGGTVLCDIRNHWLLALRAIAIGWILAFAGEKILAFFRIGLLLRYNLIFYTLFSAAVLYKAMIGWVIARTHRAHPITMVLAYTFTLALRESVRLYGLTKYSVWGLDWWLWTQLIVGSCVVALLPLSGGLLVRPRPCGISTSVF